MKKNILTTLVACVLVACLAVGGTVAFMSAGDDAVVNTFTFADGMVVDIYETKPAAADLGQAEISGTANDGLVEGDGIYDAISYTNVVPGQTLPKTPYVAAETTVDAYVFVKVEGNENITIGTIGWSKLDGEDDVYYAEVPAQEKDAVYKITTPIFTTVTIGEDLNPADFTDGKLGDIKIGVSMIQKSGFASVAAAFAEAPDFQGLSTTAG